MCIVIIWGLRPSRGRKYRGRCTVIIISGFIALLQSATGPLG